MTENEKSIVNECIDGLSESKDLVLSAGCADDLPKRESVACVLEKIRKIVYAKFFSGNVRFCQKEYLAQAEDLKKSLCDLIRSAFRYKTGRAESESVILERAEKATENFLKKIPEIAEYTALDVRATLAGDPAAENADVILLSYPGVKAVFTYRIAHVLYLENVPFVPRMMTEYAHSKTGIDINPGAKIGKSFVIDHGTGVVIGETTVIGDRVKIYQGVTLGARSLADARKLVGVKRHPTILDDVTIYAGATILGGDTVIGENCVIGSSVFITESVPKNHTVTTEKPQLRLKKNL